MSHQYYYDPDRRACVRFDFVFCRENENRFDSLEDCEAFCAGYEPVDDSPTNEEGKKIDECHQPNNFTAVSKYTQVT